VSRLAFSFAIGAVLAIAACGGSANGETTARTHVVVFAAASLKPPFDSAAKQLPDLDITFDYAGSQTLTSQLTQGAHADVFASADMAHMKTVLDAGLVSGQPTVFAHNRLEIAVQRGNPKGIHTLADLARPGIVVVLADASVPAGKYAQQALTKAGVTVKPASLELMVTAVLSKVALGDADAGIVYVSDVVTSGQVDGVAIPDDDNIIANYPIAKLKDSTSAAAADRFIHFLLSGQGQVVLAAAGFEKA